MRRFDLFWRAALARAYPRFVCLKRQPGWMLQEMLLPLLAACAFGFVYRAANAPPEYVACAVIGGAMAAFWSNVLWAMAAQFYWERDSGNLELFVIAPAPLAGVLAGMALGALSHTLVRATVILTAGCWFFGVRLAPASWPAVFGVFALSLAALYGMGMMLASLFLLWGREAHHAVNALQEPAHALSGTQYPVSTLGAAGFLAAALPLAPALDALRQLLLPGVPGLASVGWEAALLAVQAVLYLTLAGRFLASLERRAKETGRLSVRWQ